jgi:hypothetical protein
VVAEAVGSATQIRWIHSLMHAPPLIKVPLTVGA